MSPPPAVYSPRKVACIQLLLSLARKEPSLEVRSPSERKADCIQGILREEELLWDRKIPLESVLSLAKAYCQDLLGSCPETDDIAMGVKHGPGVAIGSTRGFESSYYKFSRWPYRVSPRARSLLQDVIRSDERWLGALEDSYRTRYGIAFWAILNWEVFWDRVLEDCPFNRITTVPKDGTRDRPIAVEPVGSVYLQLGIERVIRSRLKLAGLDLNDQTPNQRLAREGSLDQTPKGPVTIDLSNASDTVSWELVRAVFPPDWFSLLDSVRSPYGVLPDGTALRYAKFSSMGNGVTFVLESLVFFCLAKSVSIRFGHPDDASRIRAYGDDIVVPKYLWVILKYYLEAWGFHVNMKKSFTQGPVRESCGSDYYYGINVRPIFLKKIPDEIDELIGLRNRLHRWFVLRLGEGVPLSLDCFFLKHIERGESLPIGPESDTEMDSYWHSVQTHRMSEFVHVRCYSRQSKKILAKEFLFRKLMHSLLSVERTASGQFDVIARRSGTLCQSWRTVSRSFYRDDDGNLQDHARLRRS
jgi:hypothetical protein